MRRLPSAFRWTPLIVSGAFGRAHTTVVLGVNRSTNVIACALRDFRHRLGVELEPLVVLAAVWQIRVVQILVRDRREQHDARRGLAVVLLRRACARSTRPAAA